MLVFWGWTDYHYARLILGPDEEPTNKHFGKGL
jgi:hypothetical protein